MSNIKTLDQARNHLSVQISEQRQIINEMLLTNSKAELEIKAGKSEQAFKELMKAVDNGGDLVEAAKLLDGKDIEIGSQYKNAIDTLQMLKTSVDLDLMIISDQARYVLIGKDENLISPSGFHPSQRVYIKTQAAVQTNRLPKYSNLKAIEI